MFYLFLCTFYSFKSTLLLILFLLLSLSDQLRRVKSRSGHFITFFNQAGTSEVGYGTSALGVDERLFFPP